jgi:predicted solute-binding protein
LISKVPGESIRTLATDSSSRTSVILSRIILAEKFGVKPEVVSMAPDLNAMLEVADAALIIGDAALHIDPKALPYRVWDLGEEWTKMTGLPMVFAVWAGRNVRNVYALSHSLTDSLRHGLKNVEDIVKQQAPLIGLPEQFVRDYFAHNIAYEIGAREIHGMEAFLKLAVPFDTLKTTGIKP